MTQDSTDKIKRLTKQESLPPCMRRADRAVSDEGWIKEFMIQAPLGMVTTALDSQPFVTHNTFYYDANNHAVYMHTAKNGHLRSTVESNPKVCFAVAKMGRLLPAKVAREMSVEYASVIAYGQARIVTDMLEAVEKMSLYIKKYFPHLKTGEDYRPITAKEIREISVFEIKIDSWSAKKKEEASDFPGAFEYGVG